MAFEYLRSGRRDHQWRAMTAEAPVTTEGIADLKSGRGQWFGRGTVTRYVWARDVAELEPEQHRGEQSQPQPRKMWYLKISDLISPPPDLAFTLSGIPSGSEVYP
jgi:hypothetical protein